MLDLNTFYPSSLISFDDPILNLGFLKFCFSSVVKNGDPNKNPIMSPVFSHDSILEKFPPTRIMICESDPLRDPAYEMTLKLKKLDVDVQLLLMKDYVHGFDTYDCKNGVKEYHHATLITEQIFKEFL